jgi:hypothetical protein
LNFSGVIEEVEPERGKLKVTGKHIWPKYTCGTGILAGGKRII